MSVGPEPQPNITGERDQVASDGAFVQGRVVDREPFATPASAGDTMTGATSADVHDGLGKPSSGMTSAELRHDGHSGRKKQGLGGAEQWGESSN